MDDRSVEGSEAGADVKKDKIISTFEVEHSKVEAPKKELVQYDVFKWTKNPTAIDYLLYIPLNVGHYFKNLSAAFGWKFVFIVCMVYGAQQGLANAWFFQARDYYWKDVADISPAEAQANTAAAHTPWNIKPLYGMTSDTVSMFGYERTPYIAIAGAIGTLCFTVLASAPLSLVLAVIFMFGVNYSVASPDVMIDAIVAEKCKLHPAFASDLQSLCWGAMAAFSIIGYATSGLMIKYLGPIGTFGVLVASSLLILFPALAGFLGEPRKCVQSQEPRLSSCVEIDLRRFRQHRNLFYLAIFVSSCAVALTVVVLSTKVWIYRFVAVLLVAGSVSTSVYIANRKDLPDVANLALLIFLRESLTPDIETAMFYWYTDADNGPKFDPIFIGVIQCIGYITMLVGIGIYNKYLSTWPYRSIFTYTQILMLLTNLMDLVIVSRLNTKLGIPDECLIFGDITLTPMVKRFLMMPTFVLASKVCPDGAEATIFSMLMALSNFGSDVAIYFGSFLVVIFGVSDDNYKNFIWVIFVKSLFRLAPIPLFFILLPQGSPQKDEDYNDTDSKTSGIDSVIDEIVEESRGGDSDKIQSSRSVSSVYAEGVYAESVVSDTTMSPIVPAAVDKNRLASANGSSVDV